MTTRIVRVIALASTLLASGVALAQTAPSPPPSSPPPQPAVAGTPDQRDARANGVLFYPSKAECHIPARYWQYLEQQGWPHQYPCRALVGSPGAVACYITDCDHLP